jgi:hypothetical protein
MYYYNSKDRKTCILCIQIKKIFSDLVSELIIYMFLIHQLVYGHLRDSCLQA